MDRTWHVRHAGLAGSCRRPGEPGPGALRLLLLTGTLVLSSSCTHTTHPDPAGPEEAWAAAEASLAGRSVRVVASDGRDISIRDAVLTSTSVTGTTSYQQMPWSVPLNGVRSIEYVSRGRGALDWLLIGLTVNTVGLGVMVLDEGGPDREWALFSLVVVSATIPYVVLGTIRGSTIRFQVRPGG